MGRRKDTTSDEKNGNKKGSGGKPISLGDYLIEAQSSPSTRDHRPWGTNSGVSTTGLAQTGARVGSHRKPQQLNAFRPLPGGQAADNRVERDPQQPAGKIIKQVLDSARPKLTLIGVRLDPFVTVLFEKHNRLGHVRKISNADYYARDVLSIPAELLTLEFLVDNCAKVEDIRFIQRFLESHGETMADDRLPPDSSQGKRARGEGVRGKTVAPEIA